MCDCLYSDIVVTLLKSFMIVWINAVWCSDHSLVSVLGVFRGWLGLLWIDAVKITS